MRRLRLILLLGFVLALVLGLGIYLLGQTSLDLSTSQDGSVAVETNFPNADCTKTLHKDIPFVSFTCDEHPVNEAPFKAPSSDSLDP